MSAGTASRSLTGLNDCSARVVRQLERSAGSAIEILDHSFEWSGDDSRGVRLPGALVGLQTLSTVSDQIHGPWEEDRNAGGCTARTRASRGWTDAGGAGPPRAHLTLDPVRLRARSQVPDPRDRRTDP